MPIIQQNKDGSLKITIPKDVARELKLKKGQALGYIDIEGVSCLVPNPKGVNSYSIQEDSSNGVLKIAIPAPLAGYKGWKKGTFLDIVANDDGTIGYITQLPPAKSPNVTIIHTNSIRYVKEPSFNQVTFQVMGAIKFLFAHGISVTHRSVSQQSGLKLSTATFHMNVLFKAGILQRSKCAHGWYIYTLTSTEKKN